jgi:arginyl-tRNA synthetase
VNIIQLQTTIRETIRAAARELFDISLEQIAMEVPPRTELGDLAFPIAFELTKQLKQRAGEKRAPRSIADALKPKLESVPSVKRVEVAGAG